MKKLLLSVSLIIFIFFNCYSQGPTCGQSSQMCGATAPFPALVNSGAGSFPGAAGCLGSTPNESWFFVNVSTAGTITGSITNSAGVDIDGAIWGPYTSVGAACADLTDGSIPATVACDYTASATVPFNFVASPGVYAIVTTNYSNQATNISIGFTAGVSSICCPPTVTGGNTCIGGGTITFTQTGAAAGGPWSVNGGGTINSSGVFTPTTPGCFTATYTVPVTGCLGTKIFTVFPAAPVITQPTNSCASSFTLPTVTTVAGFTTQYSIDGGAYTATPTVPATLGCHTISARYVLTADCGTTLAGSTSCGVSNTVSFVVYPDAPVLTAPANTCNAALTIPTVTAVAGFTTQYSVDGAAYTATPVAPTTPGCHTFKAQYVVTTACGSTAASAPATVSCIESAVVSAVIFPAAPVLATPTNTCNAALTIPTVPTIAGFTTQFSVDAGTYTATPTAPNTVGCHTIKARYILTAACGATAASATGTAPCLESAIVSAIVFPAAPTSAVANTCNTALVQPTITAVTNFTVQYNVDGGAYSTAPTMPTTPGCHVIGARYVLTAACGTNPALTAPPAGCAETLVRAVIFPAFPVLTTPTNTCNSAITLPTASTVAGFNTQYSVDGGTYTTSPVAPTSIGCHTFKARYVLAADCGTTLANSASATAACLESAVVSAVIFPSAPIITAPSNTCNTALVVPTVPTIAGFTVQFSIDNGAYTASPVAPSAVGCHSFKAKYVLTAACGSTAANASAPASCLESNIVNAVVFPAAPVLTAPANTCNAALVQPTVTTVAGFTTQFSIDGGALTATPTMPSTPGCHTIGASYVLTAACGTIAAGTAAPAACLASSTVSAVVFPPIPVLTAPTNSCLGAVTLPTVADYPGFTVQYSIDAGAYSASPAAPSTAGCHTFKAKYVLTAACGATAANANAPAACLESVVVSSVIFPAIPVLAAPSNTCNAALAIPSATAVTGFTVQYSIDGGAYTSTPTAPSSVGCHSFKAKYILTAACGTTAAGTSPSGACLESATVNAVVFPNAPTAPTVTAGMGAFSVTAPATVTGFDPQYSYDNGNTWTSSNVGPTADNCSGYQVKTRYITQACGTVAAGLNNTTAACKESPATVRIVDNTPPTLTCPANVTTTVAAGTCTKAVPSIAATASDNCTLSKVTYAITGATTATSPATGINDASNTTFGLGLSTVTYTATDAAGNATTCTFTVTVTDNIPPTITCPANVTTTVAAGACTKAVPSIAATAADNCTLSKVTYAITGATTSTSPATGINDASNTTFGLGLSTVTYTATDAAGNATTCTFTVTVTDNIPPTITCPANVTTTVAAGACTKAVPSIAATAADNCTLSKVTYAITGATTASSPATGINDASNTTFGLGLSTVTYTATDAAGNATTCTFTVTVTDNIPPTITCPSNVTTTVAAGTCTKAVPSIAATAADNCTLSKVTYAITGATTATSPATGINDASNTTFGLGLSTVTYTATDAAGNATTCTFTVTVTDNIPPTITCPANVTTTVAAGACTKAVPSIAATAADNCTLSKVTYAITGATTATSPATGINDASNTTFGLGLSTVTYTATDAAGNATNCSFTVTVTDNIPPTLTCPANVTTTVAAGTCTKAVPSIAATASDNCILSKVTYAITGATTATSAAIGINDASNTTFNLGLSTVTYTATDAAGNATTCTFTVTVTDNIAPTITCPANVTTTVAAGTCTKAVPSIAATASDNCTLSKVTYAITGATTATSPATGINDASNTTFNLGLSTVTYTATDAAGNATTCTFTVTVTDNIAPTLTCPANVTTTVAAGTCTKAVPSIAATASDNCTLSKVTYAITGATTATSPATGINDASNTTFNLGLSTVTYTATDAAGNATTCTFTVTVTDNIAPTLTCPANVTTTVAAGTCTKAVPSIAATASDNCTLSKVTYAITGATTATSPATGINYASNTTFNLGLSTVTYTATDAAGNATTCTFTVTVTDNIPPTITCPANVTTTVAAGACTKAVPSIAATAADNCTLSKVTYAITGATTASSPATGINDASNTTFNLGLSTVTYTATDAAGNATTCTFTVTVTDNIAPTITCPANVTTTVAAGTCTKAVPSISATASDNCTLSKVTYAITGATTATSPATGINDASNTTFNLGLSTVTYTATDAAGNATTCTFTVTVTDNIAPTLTCPANVTTPVTAGLCTKVVPSIAATASDNCTLSKVTYAITGATTATSPATGINDASNTTFNLGLSTVTYTATDAAGNATTCTFTVTVTDNIAPTLTCPSNVTTPVTAGLCTKVVPSIAATASDNCTLSKVTYAITGATTATSPATGINDASNTTFNLGLSTVTYTATDAAGNATTCTFTVTVTDNIAPTLTCPANVTTPVTAGLCTKVVPSIAATASDNCTLSKVTYAITGATTATSPATGINDASNTTFNLGLSTVTYTATDAAGNATTCTFTVTVTDNIAPTLTCPANVTTPVTAGLCTKVVPSIAATASDNCTLSKVTYAFTGATTATSSTTGINDASGKTFNLGITNVTYTATDAAGNTTTCTFTVTVTDNIPPTLTCPTNVSVNTSTLNCTQTVSGIAATAADNCTLSKVTYTITGATTGSSAVTGINDASGTVFNKGLSTVTYTATDAAGNATSCSFTVTVIDNVKPTITCPASIVGNVGNACNRLISGLSPTVTDNCGVSTVTYAITGATTASGNNDASGTTFNKGVSTVTYTATDINGNVNTCSFTVTLTDVTPPTITCPPNQQIILGGSCAQVLPDYTGLATTSDNCGTVTVSQSPAPGTTIVSGGSYTVTLTAKDAALNTATCTFTVTVPTNAPIINCATAQNLVLGVNCSAPLPDYTSLVTASDICNPSAGLVVTQSPLPGTIQTGTGTLTVTFTATLNGQTVNCSAIITKVDNTPPTITCPANKIVNTDAGVCTATVTGIDPTNVFDACGATTQTYTLTGATTGSGTGTASGIVFNKGVTTVAYTVKDLSNNSTTCSFTVTVNDVEKPTITCPANITVSCAAAVPLANTAAIVVSDNCPGTISVTVADVITAGTCVNKFTIARTYTATDASGNTNTCTQTITVNDNAAPVITSIPADVTVQCASAVPSPNTGAVVATDNCTGTLNITSADVVTAGSCPNKYTIARTYTVKDICGNTSTQVQTITVNDNTAPVITSIPANVTVQCSGDVPSPNTGAVVATDNCTGTLNITSADVVTAGSCPNKYTIARTYTVKDICGNTSTQVQTITVNDNTAPVITSIPANVTVQCSGDVPSPNTGAVVATDNCTGTLNITSADVVTAGSCPNKYTIARTYTVKDICGNTSTQVQTITVNDNTAPVITSIPADVTVQCASAVPSPNTGAVVATDNCTGTLNITSADVVTAGSCPNKYSIARTYTVKDICGNTSTQVQTITVNDNTAPVITSIPADVTVQCASAVPSPNTGAVVATDNCTGTLNITSADVVTAGSCPNKYSIARTYTVKDICGNTSTQVQTITVNDNTAPVITSIPADVTVQCASAVPSPNTGAVVATDNCTGTLNITSADVVTAGSCPNKYSIARTYTVKDICGNTSTQVQTITVNDNTAPVITSIPADVTVQCASAVPSPNTGAVVATDNCTGTLNITSADVVTAGSCPNKYSIARTYTVKDICGNTSTQVQTITVNDNTAPVITSIPADVTVQCASAVPSPNTGAVVATDNCTGTLNITSADVVTAGSCPNKYTIARTYTVKDICGNTSTQVQTITVNDNTAPVITSIPADVTVQCASAVPSPNTGAVVATDNCTGTLNITSADVVTAGSCPNKYTIARTYTVKDICGNTSTQVQTITVNDNTAPVITSIPADVTVQCASAVPSPNTGAVVATDNCTGTLNITSADEVTAGSCPNKYSIARTYTVKDICGNTSTQVQTITVNDNTAPVITSIPADVTVQCASAVPSPNTGAVVATDNCTGTLNITSADVVTAGSCPNKYTIARTYTVKDICGNTSTQVQTITVNDNTAPVITSIPADVTVQCASAVPSPNTGAVVATDNCTGTLNITSADVVTAGSCPNKYTIARTYTVKDICGNTSTQVQTITVNDNTAPVITSIPADVTVQCASAVPSPNTGAVVATDNCTGTLNITSADVVTAGSCPNKYSIARTYTVKDICGNTSTQVQTITVNDNTAPVITSIPADVTVQCASAVPSPNTGAVVATDNCTGTLNITSADVVTAGSCPNKYSIARTYTVKDICGNTSTQVQTITVNDNTAPVITSIPADVTVQCASAVPSPNTGAVVATDNCTGTLNITSADVVTAGSCPNKYSIARTYTVKDICGNTSTQVQTITVNDNTAPVITSIPADVTVQCASAVPSPNTGAVVATDNCTGTLNITSADVVTAGSCPNKYSIARTYTVKDICGNTSTQVQTITVNDNTAPVITSIPADVTVQCASAVPSPNTGAVVATDNCTGTLNITSADVVTAGSCPNKYSIARTYTVKDICGNTSTQVQTITVNDNTAPVITSIPADVTVQCASAVPSPNTGAVVATDNCTGTLNITSADVVTAGSCPNKYTIARTYTVKDICGNTSTQVQTITVNDNTAPVITSIPADVTVQCASAVPSPNTGAVVATDNCTGTLNITSADVVTAGSCPNKYTIARTYTVKDICGNTSTQVQTITVNDNTAPVITSIPANVTVQCSGDVPSPNTGAVVATDNCTGTLNITSADVVTAGSCPNKYTIARTYTVKDICGNTSTQVQTITVNDNTAPVITSIPADVTVQCAGDVPGINIYGVSATDNCSGALDISAIDVITPGTCANKFTIARTYTVKDNCGNTSTQTQTITVNDNTPPVITSCAPNLDVNTDAGLCTASVNIGTAVAIDNCSGAVLITNNAPAVFPLGTTYVTWTATDVCSNSSTCIQKITVTDNTPPVLTCPTNIVSGSDINSCDKTITGIAASVNENCTLSKVTYDISGATTKTSAATGINDASGTVFNLGLSTVTYTATDASGNVSTCSFTVTISDDVKPVINCPTSIVANVGNNCTKIIDGLLPTVSDNCGLASVTYAISGVTSASGNSDASGTSFNIGVSTVTYTATDIHGNVNTCSFTVTLIDNTPPTINCPPNQHISLSGACAKALPDYRGVAVTTDNCAGVIVSQSPAPGTTVASGGSYPVTLTATDAAGNSTQCSFIVDVPVNPPVINCAPAQNLYLSLNCSAPLPDYRNLITASDICNPTGAGITITQNPLPGSIQSGVGNLTVTFTATLLGQTSVCSINVSKIDITPPTITCPASVKTHTAAGVCTAVINNLDPTNVFDGCGTANLTYVLSGATTGAGIGSVNGFVFNKGVTVVSYTVTDASNNITTCNFTIDVDDIELPVITCPANINVACADDVPASNPNDATVTDNCPGPVSITVSDIKTTGTCVNNFVINRKYTAKDASGNENSCTQIITVNDNVSPVITKIPSDTTVYCSSDVPAADNNKVNVTDNCSGILTISNADVITSGSCVNKYTITRTYTVKDACLNSTFKTQIITVDDNIAPVINTIPSDITVQCASDVPLADNNAVQATDNCSGNIVITNNDVVTTGTCVNKFTIARKYTATDICGNASTKTQTITVNDNIAPVINNFPSNITVQCANDVPAADNTLITATDNCSGILDISHSDNIINGTCKNNFTVERTYFVKDICGNSTSKVQTITVKDDIAPTFTAPANITIYTTANCTFDSTTAATGTATNIADNCSTGLKAKHTDVVTAGTCQGSKIITRTWSLMDSCGNAAPNQIQTITVSDTTKPTFTAPANITIYTTANCSFDSTTSATGTATNIADNCSTGLVAKHTDVVTAGSCQGSKIITRTWSLTDSCGNAAPNQIQTITVSDTTKPTFTAPANITIYTTANCTFDSTTSATGTATNIADNCSTGLKAKHTDVVTAGSCQGSKIITRTWTLTDSCGNAAPNQIQTITVSDTTKPTFTAPANITIYTTANCTFDSTTAATGTATNIADNCSTGLVAKHTDVVTAGACQGSKIITRTWSLIDSCGNAAPNQIQTITVSDTTKPTFTAPANITIYTTANCTFDSTTAATGTATNIADNCSTGLKAKHTDVVTAGSCQGSKIITRTWSLMDSCGNAAPNQIQTITVSDTTKPTFTAPANITIYTTANCTFDSTTAATGTATNIADNCSTGLVAKHSDVVTAGTCQGSKIITRTWSLIDSCGNAAPNQIQTITVSDTTKPTFTAPANITIYTTANCTFDSTTAATGTATNIADNCSTGLKAKHTDVVTAGSCQGSKIITRTWTLTDSCGNAAANQIQTITVSDTTKPTFTAPANITIYTTANCSFDSTTAATGTATNIADNCSTGLKAKHTDVVTAGSCQGSKIITRTWTLTDSCGNAAPNQIQTITVSDTTKPTFTAPANITIYTTANCTFDSTTAATGTATNIADNCSTGLVAKHSDIVTAGSCQGSKIITRTWSLTDSCGNAAPNQIQTITVSDTTKPTFTAPANITIYTTANCTFDSTTAATGTATNIADNCSTGLVAKHTDVVTAGTCQGSKIITRTWTLTDSCGNAAPNQIQTITVKDTIPPVITSCPVDKQIGTDAGLCTASMVSLTQPTVSDCSTVTITNNAPTIFPSGVTTIIWTIKDACGNTSICTQKITVVDMEPPVFTMCPTNITNGSPDYTACTDSIHTANPMVSDNCTTNPTLTWTMTGATTATGTGYIGLYAFNIGTTTITYTAKDAAGNTTTCSYNITVNATLNGAINGTVTAHQSSTTTSPITFTAIGGIGPFTFTYTVNGGSPQTITTTGTSTSATIQQANSVMGIFQYQLLSVTAANGCSMAIPANTTPVVVSVIEPLPITLIQFGGRTDNCDAYLYWQTGLEINSKYFDVQFSTDGINYQNIGRVYTKNIATGASYNFKYAQPTEKGFYRLLLVSDEKVNSSVIMLRNKCISTSIALYPNPVYQNANLELKNFGNNIVGKLFNIRGKELGIYKFTNGINKMSFAKLPSAEYVLVVYDENDNVKSIRVSITR